MYIETGYRIETVGYLDINILLGQPQLRSSIDILEARTLPT
jgi:hypothetical protein